VGRGEVKIIRQKYGGLCQGLAQAWGVTRVGMFYHIRTWMLLTEAQRLRQLALGRQTVNRHISN
jgi:hypothetical protein